VQCAHDARWTLGVMRLGIIGTMVWDRIHARDGRAVPVEEWGGITYALAAASAARAADWELVPLIKLGRDLEDRGFAFLRSLPGLALGDNVRTVSAPNNRVDLYYRDDQRRSERLTGGVPPWTWPELAPLVADLDALYVKFISGFELELATAVQLRHAFAGPIYVDLHSLFLGVDAVGMRVPHPLDAWREWLRCFDIVQVNEDELALLASAWGDPWRFAADVVHDEPRLVFVTLGPRGAAYVAGPELDEQPLRWRSAGLVRGVPLRAAGQAHSERLPPPDGPVDGDPTGCGDVWGATCFLRLLAGDGVRAAVCAANAAAARNVAHRGATGLHHHLKGRLGT
jgi:sugar/nucleoside kinase (ribokinase family)